MSPFRILVVDDSPAVCRFVDLAVGCDAVQVAGAHDAQAALAIISGNHLDLALVATTFTHLVGHDIVAALSSRSVPIAIVTGSLDQTGVDTDAATGGVLTKPLQAQPLRDLVSGIMNGSSVSGAFSDPIESWLGEADARLGFLTKNRRDLESDDRTRDRFARDVSALRHGPGRQRLAMKPSQHA